MIMTMTMTMSNDEDDDYDDDDGPPLPDAAALPPSPHAFLGPPTHYMEAIYVCVGE
jgi:hypothetical protein